MELNQTKLEKIKSLSELVWEGKIQDADIKYWIEGINKSVPLSTEHVNSLLCALSNFLYISDRLIREMLRSLYRDIYKKNIIREIREQNPNCFDKIFFEKNIKKALDKTKFLGVGNPSESGPHLLYLFRQENSLSKDNFTSMFEAFKYVSISRGDIRVEISNPSIEHYIFIDDFCGSGHQVTEILKGYVTAAKELNPNCKCHYYCLVGMQSGIKYANDNVDFDSVEAVFELDTSFNVFAKESKILFDEEDNDKKATLKDLCDQFAKHYNFPKENSYGYSGGQQLIGFHHNTPDNTIPVIWYDDKKNLAPIFKRYQKK